MHKDSPVKNALEWVAVRSSGDLPLSGDLTCSLLCRLGHLEALRVDMFTSILLTWSLGIRRKDDTVCKWKN